MRFVITWADLVRLTMVPRGTSRLGLRVIFGGSVAALETAGIQARIARNGWKEDRGNSVGW